MKKYSVNNKISESMLCVRKFVDYNDFNFLFFISLLVLFLFYPAILQAKEEQKTVKLSKELIPGLTHLLDQAAVNPETPFEVQNINKVMDFVASDKDPSTLYHFGIDEFRMNSAYYEFDMKTRIKDILQYMYNPDIPPHAFAPSSVRIAYWKQVNGQNQPLPRLWNQLSNTDSPVVVKGIEHEEITPDLSSGAYYSYDINRALILGKYNGQNFFISICRQADISDVGKKGIVLEPDEDWNYFYSGQDGITIPGLSWVSSYMYDSFSVMIYYEMPSDSSGSTIVRCGTIKWVRAGWKKINIVKSKHIYMGIDRYAKTVKAITEHPELPQLPEMESTFSAIQQLPTEELRQKIRLYMAMLEKRFQEDDSLPEEWFIELTREDQYLAGMTKRQMQSILTVEYMKGVMGKKGHEFSVALISSLMKPKTAVLD